MNNLPERELLDEEGENLALRTFLMQYSCDRSISIAAIGQHMRRSGWGHEYWPAFARRVDNAAQNLTKAGAQIWIRHLISLECRSTNASPQGDELPPLPMPKLEGMFDKWQMREYGAACRASAGAADALDAARYRQLFTEPDFLRDPLWPVVDWMRGTSEVSKEDVDAALDAARNTQPGGT